MNKVFSKFDEPISANEVAGVDIEYDTRFFELQSMAEGKPEQQYGDVIIDAEPPDWSAMEKLSSQLLSETKDLRVFCFYTQALTAKYGLSGFKIGCETIYCNLSNYWEALYPKLMDEDGEPDAYYRINALSLLSSDLGIIKQIYDSYLLTNGLSNTTINVRNAINLLQETQAIDYPGGKERLILDIRVSMDANKPELLAIRESLDLLQQIEKIYQEKLPDQQTPTFELITKPLSTILAFTNPIINDTQNTVIPESEVTEGVNPTATQPSNLAALKTSGEEISSESWRKITLNDRKDVELVLEKVCIYFEEYEPSHPAPLFIRRIQRLMNMDFYDIIKDITPNSLDTLDILIGKTQDDTNTDESTT